MVKPDFPHIFRDFAEFPHLAMAKIQLNQGSWLWQTCHNGFGFKSCKEDGWLGCVQTLGTWKGTCPFARPQGPRKLQENPRKIMYFHRFFSHVSYSLLVKTYTSIKKNNSVEHKCLAKHLVVLKVINLFSKKCFLITNDKVVNNKGNM